MWEVLFGHNDNRNADHQVSCMQIFRQLPLLSAFLPHPAGELPRKCRRQTYELLMSMVQVDGEFGDRRFGWVAVGQTGGQKRQGAIIIFGKLGTMARKLSAMFAWLPVSFSFFICWLALIMDYHDQTLGCMEISLSGKCEWVCVHSKNAMSQGILQLLLISLIVFSFSL